MIESKPSIASEKFRKYFLKEMQASGTYRRHCRRQSHPRICQNFWQFFGKDPQPQSSLIAQIWWLWQGMNIRLYIISRVINLRRSNFLIAANGHWTEWSSWTGCSKHVDCKTFDQQRKKSTRHCRNPCNGDPCSGPSKQKKKCTPRCCKSLSILEKFKLFHRWKIKAKI